MMIEKLISCFDEMVVYKDLKKSNFFSELSLPSFMRDWLLKRFEDENGQFNADELMRFVRTYLPRKDDWIAIKNRVIIERERVKFLAKVSVDIDIRTGEVSFALPDFGLSGKDTVIEDAVWQTCKDDLVRGRETWGMVEIGYRMPDDCDNSRNRTAGANRGKIKLTAFKTFCPYTIDLEYYKEARREFSTAEWLDVLLGAVDYNADGYLGDAEKKLTMLTRLLPFVEKRLNLIELAPKGTGKSYLFGRVSRFGWLSSGGVMSRAKMFYDISKGYLESGIFTVGNYEGTAEAGVILCGNIRKETMNEDGYGNMFEELLPVFHESALIERFHGFIKGWNIPRMNDDLKIAGWALNSEYFCSIMHELRDDMSYHATVYELIETPETPDTRDTEAVKRIATAYLKLLFPHVRNANDITAREFKRYCLDRAHKMRDVIRYRCCAELQNRLPPNLSI